MANVFARTPEFTKMMKRRTFKVFLRSMVIWHSPLTRQLKRAMAVNEAELSAAAKEVMPNIPGMGSLFK